MAELWVLTAVGAGILLLGFAARLAFDRWRIPDFLVLLLAGMAVGPAGANLIVPDVRASIEVVAPLMLVVAVAFIMFEAGLQVQRLRGTGGGALIVVHTLVAGGLTFVGALLVLERAFGLSQVSAAVLAAAVLGPSALVVASFAGRLNLDPRTKRALVVEGVLANVVAFFVVMSLPNFSRSSSAEAAVIASVGGLFFAVVAALGVGLVWGVAIQHLHAREGVMFATLAIALGIYALASGLLGGNGAVAVFAFGAMLGRLGIFGAPIPDSAGAEPKGAEHSRFHAEMTFFVRTFFFFYLGLLFDPATLSWLAAAMCAALVILFFIARLPSAWLLSMAWRLPRKDTIVLSGSVSRGLSDTVLVLFAIQQGIVPASEGVLLASAIFLLLIVTVVATAIIVLVAERTGAGAQAAPAAPEGEAG